MPRLGRGRPVSWRVLPSRARTTSRPQTIRSAAIIQMFDSLTIALTRKGALRLTLTHVGVAQLHTPSHLV